MPDGVDERWRKLHYAAHLCFLDCGVGALELEVVCPPWPDAHEGGEEKDEGNKMDWSSFSRMKERTCFTLQVAVG